MLYIDDLRDYTSILTVCIVFILSSITFAFVYISFQRPTLPKATPKAASEQWPFLGALAFFSRRWDFHRSAQHASRTGNFSYWLGKHPVIGLSGLAGRRAFFESRQLDLGEGWVGSHVYFHLPLLTFSRDIMSCSAAALRSRRTT